MSGQRDCVVATALRASSLAMLLCVAPGSGAHAGGFYVVPTSLELGKGAQSGAFSVVNSSDAALDFRVSVQAWSQGPDGQDIYADTQEIVYFPRIMSVEAHDQRAIRVGVKGAPPAREKAYRLFVEEIPRPGAQQVARIEEGDVSAAISFAYRFSIPIFWRPLQSQGGGALESVEMSRGEARAVLRNSGNTRLKVPAVTFRGRSAEGRELFAKELNGWYLLQGMSRTYTFTVPPELCGALAVIEVEARTEKGEFDGILNVQKEMCNP